MPLTVMEVYKNLPKTNCKDCGLPTCMAFAMQVAGKQKALTDCPHVSSDAQEAFSEASSPPMKLVKIGTGDKEFEMGQETVMFRHEEKFHHASGIAVRVPASLSDEEASAKIEQINKSSFERVGQTLKIQFTAVEIEGTTDPAARAQLAAEKSNVPLILMGDDPEKMKPALAAIKDQKPLLYKANSSNIDQMASIANEMKVPLGVSGTTLSEMADLTGKAKDKGVEEMVLVFNTENPGETLRMLTTARRAALKNNFRPLGYPSMVEIKSDSPENTMLLASSFAVKYATIVLIDNTEPEIVLPIMASIQNIYTDPQVPNTVEAKLYEIGSPRDNAPVMFTTNFSLTYFSVASEVERSKVPAYICVVDTEGLGVLNAYAGDKISAEKVVKTLQNQQVAEKVKHRKLIIPGLLPIFRAEIEDTSNWKEVIIGPENARGIPAFLNQFQA